MMKSIVLGVDIGGSHITAALLDLNTGKIIDNSLKRNSVNANGDKEEILAAWTAVINESFGNSFSGEKKIGLAMPGPFDYENGISLIKEQTKFRSLYQLNIKQELAETLNIPLDHIKFINDAAAFMQGEFFCGAANGYQRALGLTLGTGLGSAVVINGKSEDANLWNAKFLSGIAEDYLSTRWFVNKYRDLTGKELEGVKELAAIVDKDTYAKQIFNEFGRGLGHFLADIIKQTEAEVVVLGGNISNAFYLFEAPLKDNLSAFHINTEIKITALNEQAALIGAASSFS